MTEWEMTLIQMEFRILQDSLQRLIEEQQNTNEWLLLIAERSK